jgi:threonine synthase
VAGVRKLVRAGAIDPGATIVCVLTGVGLKDPERAAELARPVVPAHPSVDGVRKALGW